MIFWGRNKVKIIKGDLKKREAVIKPIHWYNSTELILVGWESLKADGGVCEIVQDIKKLKGVKKR